MAPSSSLTVPTVTVAGASVSKDSILKGLYILAVFLSGFMALWVLMIPASWRIGWDNLPFSAYHRRELEAHFERETANGSLGIVPRSLVFKYEGHADIQVCHTLASVLWSGIIPFQFHKGFRRQYPICHRWMGRVFVIISFIMMWGVALTIQRGLTFVQYDFGDIVSPSHKMRDLLGLGAASTWFLFTAGKAWWAARCRRFIEHQAWVIRHVGAGLWVALQRLFVNAMGPATTRAEQCENFSNSASLGMIVAVVLSELAVSLANQSQGKKTAKIN